MKNGQGKYRLFPIWLLTLFVAYQVSVTMFAHVHYVNGVMIVHSHPNNNQNHTHTEGQVLTLAHVASFVSVEPNSFTLDSVQWLVLDEYDVCTNLGFYHSCDAQHIRLRAPPVQC